MVVYYLHSAHGLSVRKSCLEAGLSRTGYYHQPAQDRDESVILELMKMAERYPRYGFRKLFVKLRQSGFGWNHKQVYRIYCSLQLNIHRKGKKRLPARNRKPLIVPEIPNHTW